MTLDRLRIGAGAGGATDRIDAAVDLVKNGDLDWIVLECLAERTIAHGQRRERSVPGTGFDPLTEKRMRPLLGPLKETGTRLITSLGAANPLAAGHLVCSIAGELGIELKVAVVLGDDVISTIDMSTTTWEDGLPLSAHDSLISANAYIGIDAILPAIESGADVILTGRAADPSLFLAPMVHDLGWSVDDYQSLAAGTAAAHLLECGAQVTGGYFVDPPYKQVPDLAHVGFPIAEVSASGSVVITKLPGTGGVVNFETVSEQLTYEVTDPHGYVTPDIVLDFGGISLTEVGPDRVEVTGAAGRPRPTHLKVVVGQVSGFLGEGEMSYAGPGCMARAALSAEIVKARLSPGLLRVQLDIVGVDSMLGGRRDDPAHEPLECRVRLGVIAATHEEAQTAVEEVIALYTNGPAGGGGCRTRVEEQIGILSILMDRTHIPTHVEILEAR